MSRTEETRIEHDSMGEMQVPAQAYWGASTHRAVHQYECQRGDRQPCQ